MEQYDAEELMQYIQERKFRLLRARLSEMNEADIAEFLGELEDNPKVMVFRMLPKELAADVFAFLEPDVQEHIINSITDAELAKIIEDLFVDDAVDMLEELPATVVKRVMRTAGPETRSLINQFLKYPENSAGSIMTAEYIGLKKYMNVEQAFAYIRAHGVDKETIYTCFVTDAQRRLEGVVTIKDLLMNPYDMKIQDIMDENVIKAVTTEDQEEVVDLFNKYDLMCLPVVDHEDRLVGIVTVDDVVDVMEEEATEDIEKMAAMLPSDKPYLKTGILELARNRIVWLTVLMLSSMITGSILLCTYADRYGRKCRKSIQYYGDPCHDDRRCGAERYSENCLERDPRGSGGWHYPGITEFYKADGSISGRDNGVYHGCGESGRDHYSGEDHWMYIADPGTDPSSGSGDHGGSVDLNHRRCMQSDRIFSDCLQITGYLMNLQIHSCEIEGDMKLC